MGGAFALLPLYIGTNLVTRNLTTQSAPLSGHQVMRGPFLNSGSIDAGKDPDWVDTPRGRVYVGKNKTAPTEAQVAAFREQRGARAAATLEPKL